MLLCFSIIYAENKFKLVTFFSTRRDCYLKYNTNASNPIKKTNKEIIAVHVSPNLDVHYYSTI